MKGEKKPKVKHSTTNVMYDFIPSKVDETRDDLDNVPRREVARLKVTGKKNIKTVYRNCKLLITPLVDRECAVKVWLQDQDIYYTKFKILRTRQVPWNS